MYIQFSSVSPPVGGLSLPFGSFDGLAQFLHGRGFHGIARGQELSKDSLGRLQERGGRSGHFKRNDIRPDLPTRRLARFLHELHSLKAVLGNLPAQNLLAVIVEYQPLVAEFRLRPRRGHGLAPWVCLSYHLSIAQGGWVVKRFL